MVLTMSYVRLVGTVHDYYVGATRLQGFSYLHEEKTKIEYISSVITSVLIRFQKFKFIS